MSSQIAISECHNRILITLEVCKRGEERKNESRNIGWGVWNKASSSDIHEAEADAPVGE